ncbi:unnamed protein product [Coffea canephora]|uniref:Uncharacterized protein n=1 Tax=Coffea canephora TaxID=49390 RepID=A0A068U764_COFCA|nr:unnamed protein product [Coffea canephora]
MVVPWGGVSCCLSAAALYLLGMSSGRDADILKSVTRVNQLKDLGCKFKVCILLSGIFNLYRTRQAKKKHKEGH